MVENNYVIFANYCWRIVRTSENGSIKLRYNGVTSGGSCSQTGTDTSIGTSSFNSSSSVYSYNAGVGYMYGTPNSSTYALEHANVTNSTIKTYIETWYSTNIANQGTTITSKISDTIYCNDRSIVDGTLGYAQQTTQYAPYTRLNTNKTPSNKCTLANDRFTVSSSNGNGELTYSVALLTSDELVYAGAVWGASNDTFYLYTNVNYWTMSPSYFSSSSYASVYNLDTSGNMFNYFLAVRYSEGVFPVISLNESATVSSGNGTYSTPYVIY